jgi:hypothetical protein
MPQSIPAGLTREHILRTLVDLDTGLSHPFGNPTGYELVYGEKLYAPKAVIGLACRYSIGRILQPNELAPGQANFVLRKLGFTVTKKSHEDKELQTSKDWSEHELRLIIADYFDMLEAELMGKQYKKSEHRKALMQQLSGRSEGSIEFKYQNVSGVLVELGLPYIGGYKPRSHYQSMMVVQVDDFLDEQPNFLEKLAQAPIVNPTNSKPLTKPNLAKVIEAPPANPSVPAPLSKPWITRKPLRINFAERDAVNKKLGLLGEEFVLELEKYRLQQAGRDDLAKKILWASRDIGDGLGFDILSYDEVDESEQLLEVKTTGLGKSFPFYVTANEIRCSEDIPDQYRLYRVFDFGRIPRLYILHGSLRERCQLEPIVYRAVI